MLVDFFFSFKNWKQRAHPSKEGLTVLSKTNILFYWINWLKCGAFTITEVTIWTLLVKINRQQRSVWYF